MKIGYVRVSTAVQVDGYSLDEQKAKLRAEGCEKIFEDVMSGAKKDRPGLKNMLDAVRAGDVVMVVKLDRLGRSVSDLNSLMTELKDAGVEFVSLAEKIDTNTITGRLMFNILGSIAEFERELIIERTQAGIAQARAAGVKFGAPVKLDMKMVKRAVELKDNEKLSAREKAAVLGVSRASFYRLLKQAEDLGLLGDGSSSV